MTRDDLADRVAASFDEPPVDTARLRRPEKLVRPDLAIA
jgi:hypothetical protein